MVITCEAKSRNRARKLRLLLDSGANSLVLLHSTFRALDLPTHATGFESTTAGQVTVPVGRVPELAVGAEKLHDLVVALLAGAPPEFIGDGDGLLPTGLFRALYINSREGFVVLNPRPKRTNLTKVLTDLSRN